ncbi:MAG TPA: methyltransferase domain-containing protein [Candidatus Acidoferrum sp.]|nr:methyltransferase domain-containing protein [Candidatus Acidoferrum sp.]
MTADWDATTYDRIADPMTRWGSAVLGRLPLDGDELVLDAGCGSGRVTEALLARLPRGHVIALDGSPAMIDEARHRLSSAAGRVTFITADLLQPLPVEPPVDAILSTATFHWIPDHDTLFRNLAAVLRPGGWFVAQCGGAGNIETVLAAARLAMVEYGLNPGWRGPWLFATPEETEGRLSAAGFTDIETWLNPEPTPLEPGEPLETYLATVILRDHLPRLPTADRAPFVHAVATRLPRPEIDYMRLNIVARRAE